ncbi:MAG: acyltransferase [Candidatus Zixiibacteriota bacterium]|nr:MAG: acyltransferase [candidate division Zixibacteria bacterium]
MIDFIANQLSRVYHRLLVYRQKRRWRNLRRMGMQLGKGVNLPMSTWIDISHCFLISIGDNCGFGENCAILAHDAMPNEYLDASRLGRVIIHESCHFGMGTIILPGVEIGPRSVVGAGSVVLRDIPPNSLAAGNPAKVICSLDEYLDRHREKMKTAPLFQFKEYDYAYLTPEKMQEMLDRLADTDGYMVGGYTAMVEDGECLLRTD